MNIYWAPTLYVPALLFHVLEIQPFQKSLSSKKKKKKSPSSRPETDTYNKPKKKRKIMLDMPEC